MGMFGSHYDDRWPAQWMERESREQAGEARHQRALRRAAERTCHARPNDRSQRLTPMADGNGQRARCHRGSDGEACPDDEMLEPSWRNIASERSLGGPSMEGDDPDEYLF